MARRPKTKKKLNKGRLLRLIYRRGRVYVPVVALLMLAMAFVLPISPPGLAGYIGRTIESRTGMPISVDAVRVRLIAGEVTLSGIELRDRNGGESFRIGAIYLSGDFAEFIAGSGRWPAEVIVDNPTEVHLRYSDGRLEPHGALATLVEAIANAELPELEDEEELSLDVLERPTPAVTIRNVQAVLLSDDPRLSGTRVALQQIHMPQRIGGGEAIKTDFNGIATAGLAESFSGTFVHFPRDDRYALDVRLDGIKRDVSIHGFGDVHMAARGIELSASAHQIEEGIWQVGLDQEFDRFEISEMRTGGERWIEEDLSVRVRGLWNIAEEQVKEATLSIGSEEIDLALMGGVRLDQDMVGDAKLRIRRFPAPLIALGQRLARDEGFTVSRSDTARLLVDVAIAGPFARVGEMDVDGTVEIAGWSFQRTGWPDAVTLHEARGAITNSTMELSNLRLSSGTLDASGRLTLPITMPEGETRPGSLDLSLHGTPETAFDFLRVHDINVAVVTAATVPLSINLHSEFEMGRSEGLLEPTLEPGSLRVKGGITWGEGMLLLDIVPGTIVVQAGGLTFDDSGVILDALVARRDDVGLRLWGRVELAEPGEFASPFYNGELNIYGPIADIRGMVETQFDLPEKLDTFDGHIDLRGNLQGIFARDQWPTYDMIARISDAQGVVTFQINPARFTKTIAEIHLTNEQIEIRHLETQMEDDTQGAITALITRSGILATVATDTTLETVQYILPHELEDMVMMGPARAEGEVRLEVNRQLPEAPDLMMAWIGALSDPVGYKIHVTEDSPLRLRINAELTPLEPVTLFHRDFPHQVDNIRGIVRADELGFIMESVASRWGDAEDVIVSGRVTLGHIGPLHVTFEAVAPALDLNDWIDGWGQREWADIPRPGREARRVRRDLEKVASPTPRLPRLQTTINGHLQLGRTRFLTVRSENMIGQLEYEAWQGAENKLRVNVEESLTYGGSLRASASLLFHDDQLPHIRASIDAVEVGVNGFMTDLRESEEQTVGKFTGRATLDGLLIDYSTWVGEGDYIITDSKFIGDQVLIVLSRAMRLGFEQTQANTTWRGTGTYRGEVVHLPDIKISNNEFNLVADGTVGFNGSLDFRIGVEFLGNRIEWIPLIGRAAPLVNRLTDFLLSARLEGTVHDPRVRVVPLSMDATPLPRSASGGRQ